MTDVRNSNIFIYNIAIQKVAKEAPLPSLEHQSCTGAACTGASAVKLSTRAKMHVTKARTQYVGTRT